MKDNFSDSYRGEWISPASKRALIGTLALIIVGVLLICGFWVLLSQQPRPNQLGSSVMLHINPDALQAAYGPCEQGLDVVTWDVTGRMLRFPEGVPDAQLPSDGFGPLMVMCGYQPAMYHATGEAPYWISAR